MTEVIINYFRNNLRKQLKRALCCRYLPLWNDEVWMKGEIDINVDYIKANNFLIFLYQTKKDLCCMEVTEAQMLSNSIDKFFFLLFDFQSYFNVFLNNKLYSGRIEIINDIMKYKKTNYVSKKFVGNIKFLELFFDFVKKLDEWAYWKRLVVVSFTKIIITEESYKQAQLHQPAFLQKLLSYVEEIFNRGMNTE